MYISLFKEFVIEFLLEVGGGVFVVGVGVCEINIFSFEGC